MSLGGVGHVELTEGFFGLTSPKTHWIECTFFQIAHAIAFFVLSILEYSYDKELMI